jgi:hypothetical protein
VRRQGGVLSQTLLNRIRATLDEGPGSNEFRQSYWPKALKLVEPKAFRRGSKTKSTEPRIRARDQGVVVQLKDSICFK